MDMQPGGMEKEHGYEAWTNNKHEVSTCSRDMQGKYSSRNAAGKMQHRYAAWRHGHAPRTSSMDKQRVHGASSIDMQHGDMDMQRGQAAWTCNVYMQLEQGA